MSHHPAITSAVHEALLKGGNIESVYSHKGEPGGHNNDRLGFHMESGETIWFDIYSLYPLAVKVEHRPRKVTK